MTPSIAQVFDAINAEDDDDAINLLRREAGLIHQRMIGGRTPLHQAAFLGRQRVVEFLIAENADVNAVTESGWSPLFYACAPLDESIGVRLIEAGANVNVRNNAGDTALHFAASYGKLAIAKAILASGGEINAKSSNGETPLDEAEDTAWKPMIDFLMENGAESGRPPKL